MEARDKSGFQPGTCYKRFMSIKEIFPGAVEELPVGPGCQSSGEEDDAKARRVCIKIYDVLPWQVEEVDDGATHAPKAARPILIPVWESPCLLTPFLSAWKTSKHEGATASGGTAMSEYARIEVALDRISQQVDACLAQLLHGVVSFGNRQGTVAWCDETSEGEAHDPDAAPRLRRHVHKARTVDLKIATQIFGGKDEAAATKPMMRLLYRSRCDDIWEMLDDPESSRAAWWISQALKVAVILSILVTNLHESLLQGAVAAFLETTFDTIFLIEFLCRVFSAPSKREYFKDTLNWADMLSAFGLPLRASIGFVMEVPYDQAGNLVQVILLFALPILRLLKLLRTAIPSLQHALWLCVVTMTTVGYGDYVPKTAGGYVVVSVLVIVSVLFVAMPVGIIGHEFTSCWQTRDRVLCITRARQAMVKWGYSANDVKALFEYVDMDHDGNLDLLEFIELVRQMRVGLSVERSIGLFMLSLARKDVQQFQSSEKVHDALEALTATKGAGKAT
eukprot:s3765_g6.t1